jgi:hypothetical protein
MHRKQKMSFKVSPHLISGMPSIEESKLLHRNKVAAIAHIASFIGLLIAYNYWSAAKRHASRDAYRLQIAGPFTGTQGANPNEETNPQCTTDPTGPLPGQCITEPIYQPPRRVLTFNVIVACLAFFAFTAAAHLFYAYGKSYLPNIRAGWNPYRWGEYAISATLMSIILGFVDGANDVNTLLALAVMTAAMQFCGFTTESLLKGTQKVNKTAILGTAATGWLLFIGLWTILIYSFTVQVHDVDVKFKGVVQTTGPQAGKPIKVPSWVLIVIIIQLVNYALFGIVQLQHIRARLKGPVDFGKYESAYIGLSFSAKLALAAGLGYGLIFRVKNC